MAAVGESRFGFFLFTLVALYYYILFSPLGLPLAWLCLTTYDYPWSGRLQGDRPTGGLGGGRTSMEPSEVRVVELAARLVAAYSRAGT